MDLINKGDKNKKTQAVSQPTQHGPTVLEGQRIATLTSMIGSLISKGVTIKATLKACLTDNWARFVPPLSRQEVRTTVEDLYSRYTPSDISINLSPQKKWSVKLSDKAYYGVAGKFIELIDPYTEADPVAILLQFLTQIGNVVYRNYYWSANPDLHYPNLYTLIIGDTAAARKGTSYSCSRIVPDLVDPLWSSNCVTTGLSSGEGLIDAVRDTRYKTDPKTQEETVEAVGVNDKRLMVVESEFATVFKSLAREGCTLSPVVRDAWDGKSPLNVMTKNSKNKATGAHISIIGHITKAELLRCLTATELSNGFINRFLIINSTRSKYLSNGADLSQIKPELQKIALDIKSKIVTTSPMTCDYQLFRDHQAQSKWDDIYRNLSSALPGLLGDITSRKEAITMRLASIYAILDGSPLITLFHLDAALAIIDYYIETCRFIFGSKIGDNTADTIMEWLTLSSTGLTKSDIIHHVFKRNKKAEEIDRALKILIDANLAYAVVENNFERWFACTSKAFGVVNHG